MGHNLPAIGRVCGFAGAHAHSQIEYYMCMDSNLPSSKEGSQERERGAECIQAFILSAKVDFTSGCLSLDPDSCFLYGKAMDVCVREFKWRTTCVV